MMRKVLISILIGVPLMCGAWAATPAESVISPSPLDCSITGGGCTPLSGVGSLIFGGGPGTITVAYQMDSFQVDGCPGCFNFEVGSGPGGVPLDPSLAVVTVYSFTPTNLRFNGSPSLV